MIDGLRFQSVHVFGPIVASAAAGFKFGRGRRFSPICYCLDAHGSSRTMAAAAPRCERQPPSRDPAGAATIPAPASRRSPVSRSRARHHVPRQPVGHRIAADVLGCERSRRPGSVRCWPIDTHVAPGSRVSRWDWPGVATWARGHPPFLRPAAWKSHGLRRLLSPYIVTVQRVMIPEEQPALAEHGMSPDVFAFGQPERTCRSKSCIRQFLQSHDARRAQAVEPPLGEDQRTTGRVAHLRRLARRRIDRHPATHRAAAARSAQLAVDANRPAVTDREFRGPCS